MTNLLVKDKEGTQETPATLGDVLYAKSKAPVKLSGKLSNKGTKTAKVRIVPSIEYLERLLERQFPSAHVNLTAGGDNILLVSGNVDSPANVTAIVKLNTNGNDAKDWK